MLSTKFPVEGAILFPVGGGEEIGYPNINANDRRIRRRLNRYYLIIGEREPPCVISLVQGNAAVNRVALLRFRVGEDLNVVVSQFDRNKQGMTFIERTHLEPIIKRGIGRGF
jgi:hypothetical protein